MRSGPTISMLLALTGCAGESTQSGTSETGEQTSTGDSDGPAPVRAFAVGNLHGLGYVGSYAEFTGEMQRLMDLVTPDLAAHDNLVVFGEDVGLPAAFLGSRGEQARAADSALAAFVAASLAYQPILDHYKATYPQVSFNRLISLALTDTMARAFFGTFPALAEQHSVYLSACTLLPKLLTSERPEDIALFGDPDLEDERFVYIAAGPEVYNVCYLWGRDGAEIGASRKVNLVALEGPEMLDLTPESLENVVAYDLPFGRVAIAISLDAFKPDYVGHLNQLGAEIVLQNDANPGRWAITQAKSDHIMPQEGEIWQPEEWRDSTIRMVEHPDYASIQYNVCPMIVGNLFDIPFDGQSSITAREPPAGLEPRGYIGDAPQGRFLALAPWAAADPGEADPSLTLAQRRAALEQIGEQLAPGSDDPRENAYRENVVWADLQVRR